MKRNHSPLLLAKFALVILTFVLVALCFVGCDLWSAAQQMAGASGCTHPNMKFFPYTAPKCDEMGNKDVYACPDCQRYFLDAEGKIPTTDTYIILLPLGGDHEYADGTCVKCGQCQHLSVTDCVCGDCHEAVHNLEYVFGVSNTCDEDGNSAHYVCSDCGRLFYDRKATYETTLEEITIEKHGHNYHYDGICWICGNFDESKVVCQHYTIMASKEYGCVCSDCGDPAHPDLEFYNDPPTCTEDGYRGCYRCPLCEKVYFDENAENEIHDFSEIFLPKLGGEHNYVGSVCTKCGLDKNEPSPDGPTKNPFESNYPACQHPDMEYFSYSPAECGVIGYNEHYHCTYCGDSFYDAEGKNKMDFEDTFVAPLEHKIVGGVCERCGNLYVDFWMEDVTPENYHLKMAYNQLLNLYLLGHREPTSVDFELVSKIVTDDGEFTVTWTIVNESITLTYDASREVYIVIVPKYVSENCYYTYTATLTDDTGHGVEHAFVGLLEATE